MRGARVFRLLQVDRRADDVAAGAAAAGGHAQEEAAGTTEAETSGAVPAPRAVQAVGQEAVADAQTGRHQGLVPLRAVGRGPTAD